MIMTPGDDCVQKATRNCSSSSYNKAFLRGGTPYGRSGTVTNRSGDMPSASAWKFTTTR